MNEQKHTPGHWYATSGYVAVKTQNGHRVICSMSRTDSCMNYAAGVGSTEDASNARLIAAATWPNNPQQWKQRADAASDP